jgi:DNA-binding MarR family transcriptional regulator
MLNNLYDSERSMTPQTIRADLKQLAPMQCTEQEAFLALLRTADVVAREFGHILRPHGLTLPHYNILRILKGAEQEGGRTNREIAERLITQAPDVSRFLDRLETSGLAKRTRPDKDKRIVRARITKKGLQILQRLHERVLSDHKRFFGPLGQNKLHALCDLLDELRSQYRN